MSGNKNGSGIGAGLLVLVAAIVLGLFIDLLGPAYGFFGKVPTGSVGIVTHFGEVKNESLAEGFHAKGFFDKITNMNLRTQKRTYNFLAFSKDIQEVNVQMTIAFNIDATTAPVLFKTIGTEYDEIILQPRVYEDTKVIFSRYTAEQLVENRDALSNEICALLASEMMPKGINISEVSILDIDFSDAFTNAVEAKQVATQEKLRTQTEQERKTIEETEAAKRKVIAAQADADAQKATADAEAYSIRVKAEAEAEANALINASLTDALIDYTRAQKWDGQYPSTYFGGGEEFTPMIAID